MARLNASQFLLRKLLLDAFIATTLMYGASALVQHERRQTDSTSLSQTAVATICPTDGSPVVGSKVVTTDVLPISVAASGTVQVGAEVTITTTVAAPLPNGSSTVFLSAALQRRDEAADSPFPGASLVEDLPSEDAAMQLADMARVVLGDDGCQTIFSPDSSQVCSTTIKPLGLPAISITNCDQAVTFSTADIGVLCESGPSSASASPTGPSKTTSTGRTRTRGRTTTPITLSSTTAPVVTSAPTSSDIDETGTESSTSFTQRPRRRPTAGKAEGPIVRNGESTVAARAIEARDDASGHILYYMAPWQDLISSDVPPTVTVEDCRADSTTSMCQTSMEGWSLSDVTSYTTGTSIAKFSGRAILTSSTRTYFTFLTFSATFTTTQTITMPTIVRTPMTQTTDDMTVTQTTITNMETMPIFTDEPTMTDDESTTTITSSITVTTTIFLSSQDDGDATTGPNPSGVTGRPGPSNRGQLDV